MSLLRYTSTGESREIQKRTSIPKESRDYKLNQNSVHGNWKLLAKMDYISQSPGSLALKHQSQGHTTGHH